MFFGELPYITIIVAALLGMGVGFVWYAPWAFGKLWLKSKGWSDELLREKKEGKSMVPTYVFMTLGNVALALVLAVLFNSLMVIGFSGIFTLAFLTWLGFVVPVKLGDYLYGGDSFTFFLISIGYNLAAILVMSYVIGIFGN